MQGETLWQMGFVALANCTRAFLRWGNRILSGGECHREEVKQPPFGPVGIPSLALGMTELTTALFLRNY
jgi:hypothetical protein